MSQTEEVRIQLRRDTANNWQGVNPVLAEGEMGIEIDTRKFKFGDGVTAWNSLPYIIDEIPTKVSQLINDSHFVTQSSLNEINAALTDLQNRVTALENK